MTMKTIKYLIIILALALISSCEDFLEEKNKTGVTEDLVYSTEEAIDGLVASCYAYNRLWYGKEAAITISEAGTDLWYVGKDNRQKTFVNYQDVSADPPSQQDYSNCLDEYWEAFYAAINLCNVAIKYVSNVNFLKPDKKLRLLSEVRFLRAFYYWHLVEIWGPVQINKEPVENPITIATRNSIEEVYEFMMEDVQFAIDNLSPSVPPNSRVTYWAAKAFMARLALYYASEYGKTEYYPIAAQHAKDVINNSGKSLAANYEDVWKIENSTTSKNPEFIWAIDYYNDIGGAQSYNFVPRRMKKDAKGNPLNWSSLILRRSEDDKSGGGNVMHLMFTPLWNSQTDTFGGPSTADILARVCGVGDFYTVASPSQKVKVDVGYFYVKYAMGYTRYAPTRYCLDLFDETKDQRWNVSFRTVWYKHPAVVPKDYGLPTCLYPNMTTGTNFDTALYYSKRPLTPEKKAWAKGRYKAIDVTYTFQADGVTPNTLTGQARGETMYAMLRKFENTDSKIAPSTNFNDYFSYRDFPVFRISEMYLIAAEALMQNETTKPEALALINTLREKRAIPGKESEMSITIDQLNLDFILEERARELIGENMRRFDLKRTRKLETQIQHNPYAKSFFDPSKHYLMPIPSTQMNAVTNRTDGPTPGGFWQNPGY